VSDDSFTAILGFSLDPWPIPQATVVVSDSVNSINFLLIALPDGSLGLRVIRNGANEDYETDVVVPEGGFKVVTSIVYTPLTPNIRLNGTEIAVAPVGSRQKVAHLLKRQSPISPKKNYALSTEVPELATDSEALFVRTISDLANASMSNDWYVLLKSSGHLRLLLLDGLLHKANERHRLRLKFRVAAPGEPPPIDFDKLWTNIAPHDLPDDRLADLNLEQFLKLSVFESKHARITVKDIINAVANADGGVHLGKPRQAQEELILAIDKEAMRFGQAASRHMLKEICSVVVAGSERLVEKIQGKIPGAA